MSNAGPPSRIADERRTIERHAPETESALPFCKLLLVRLVRDGISWFAPGVARGASIEDRVP